MTYKWISQSTNALTCGLESTSLDNLPKLLTHEVSPNRCLDLKMSALSSWFNNCFSLRFVCFLNVRYKSEYL